MIEFDMVRSFWGVNAHLKSVGVFGEVYKNDKSNNKERSSKYCWAAALYASKTSPLRNMTDDDKKKSIERDIFGENGGFKRRSEKLLKIAAYIQKIEETPAHRLYKQWCDVIEKRKDHIDELMLDYGSNVDKIDKMMLLNGKLFDELDRIEKMLHKEDLVTQKTKGGSEESLSEKGALNID